MTLRDRPWLACYDDGQPFDIDREFDNMLTMFAATAQRHPDQPILRYFDGVISARQLDDMSDAFAAALAHEGLSCGDRVALYLQNVPQYVIALLGTWKAGGVAVSVNPMNKHRELAEILTDSGARALICLETLYEGIAKPVLASTDVHVVITTSELELQTRNDSRIFKGAERVASQGTHDMMSMIERYRGHQPPPLQIRPDDAAVLTYTSGTTGPPKGAIISHSNIAFSAQTMRDWIQIGCDDVVLGIAPLFHVTGLVGHIALSLLSGATLVLMYRLDPAVTIETVEDTQATFTVGSITAFIALMNAPNATRRALRSMTKIYSGGAPISPGLVMEFEQRFGHYIHNIYGLTETTSPALCVPLQSRAPVGKDTGVLAVGVPVYDTRVNIVDENGSEVRPGQLGEIVITGPQVVAGYWNKPEETTKALTGGYLRTGDVGYMDDEGWFYLVDRIKDQINAGGYKIWPREVEDVLYEHPAVREAAVVGIPDGYRGETVKAFVSLRPGTSATPSELIAFCRERLAAYKYPREVDLVTELPKTASGKIRRRDMREVHPEGAPQTSDVSDRTKVSQ